MGSEKNRPIKGDKLKLVETCFASFLTAFEKVDYRLVVLLDKPNQAIRKMFEGHDTEEYFFGDFNEGNVGTFHRQIDLALEMEEDFLFVEDDYYWVSTAGPKIKAALKDCDGFLTPYDHPDHYVNVEFDRKEWVKILGNHHFKTTLSTTLTFGGKYEALKAEADTMKKYGWVDHPMWKDVTQRYPLYSAIPSLATHMETEWLAPVIEWSF